MTNNNQTKTFYLASFPRSGNTWLRFLIANVYNNIKQRFDEIDFFNIHEVVPEYKGEDITALFDDFPTILKTHDVYTESFNNAILLLRDPIDTLHSYRDFLSKNQGIDLSFEEIVRHELYGISAVVGHADSYVTRCENLLIMTYEKLHSEPQRQMEKLFDFINFQVPPEIIDRAIRQSSFGAMSRIEKEKGRKYGSPSLKHIRNGKVGEGMSELEKNSVLKRYLVEQIKKSPLLYWLYM